MQKQYIKIDTDIFEQLNEAGMPLELQIYYMKLSAKISDGNVVNLTNKELFELFGSKYHRSMGIIKKLQECNALNIIAEKGMPNKYQLLIGVYKGFREATNPFDDKPTDQKGTLLVSSTKSTGSHVRAVKSKPLDQELTLKQQHGEVPVVVNLKFKSNSPFEQISKKSYSDWEKLYGQEQLQRVITRAEQSYPTMDKINTTPGAILNAYLKGNYELDTLADKRQRQRELKSLEREHLNRKLEEKSVDIRQEEYDMEDFFRSSHPQLIKNEEFILTEDRPDLDIDGAMFQGIVYQRARMKYLETKV